VRPHASIPDFLGSLGTGRESLADAFAQLGELDEARGEYEAALPARRVLAARSRLWILWQKGQGDGLNGNFVRQGALAMGLVDYKICSVDGVWSGMVFAVKKARG
jgi:hypothetical protein